MSGPAKEGARQCPTFKAIGTAPSINKTPVGDKTPPLPYATFQDLSNSVAVVPNVMLNGKPAYVLEQSIQPTCQGDEPGTEKGVKSGTVSGYVKPQNASSTVTMMGMLSVRFGDPCVMNGGNNPGIYTTEEPAAANPAKSAAETSDPDIELETPEETSSVGDWLDETVNDIGEWWEQTKYEMGEAVDNPWEGTKGGVKGILNVAPETGEMIIKTLIKQQANKFELVGTLLNLLGGTESAQGANTVSQILDSAGNSVNAPKFEMNNAAQAGGNNIVTGVTSVTGLMGIVKSAPRLFAKFGSKASKEADEVVKEATSPGDGVVVKPAKAEPKNGDAVQGGRNSATPPNRIYSARELLRRAEEPGPFHNFPESYNDEIFQGTRTVVSPDYVLYTKPGTIAIPGKPIFGNSSTMIGDMSVQKIIGYTPSRTVEGVFEIGVKPSVSGRTEVITHRFFRPNE